MPYYLVSSTKEAHVYGKNEDDARINFCTEIDSDHSGAYVTELDPIENKDDIKWIKEQNDHDGVIEEIMKKLDQEKYDALYDNCASLVNEIGYNGKALDHEVAIEKLQKEFSEIDKETLSKVLIFAEIDEEKI